MDVIEIDAASNRGIDEMRSLREAVRYVPVMGGYKVYIVDEVHMLTQEAFNALLKTLEEPPEHVIFIMATTAPHKIPVTITSRCQRLDFRRLSVPDIEAQMEKILQAQSIDGNPVSWERGALRLIARAGQGSMRDALSILDLCLTYGGTAVREEDVREILGETSSESMRRLFRAIAQRDIQSILDITRDASDRGKDMGELCQEIGQYSRDMILLRSGAKASDIGRPQDEVDSMLSIARTFPTPLLIAVLDAVSKAAVTVKTRTTRGLYWRSAFWGCLWERMLSQRAYSPEIHPREPMSPSRVSPRLKRTSLDQLYRRRARHKLLPARRRLRRPHLWQTPWIVFPMRSCRRQSRLPGPAYWRHSSRAAGSRFTPISFRLARAGLREARRLS